MCVCMFSLLRQCVSVCHYCVCVFFFRVMNTVYDIDGYCVPMTHVKQAPLVTPKRLIWDVVPKLERTIGQAVSFARQVCRFLAWPIYLSSQLVCRFVTERVDIGRYVTLSRGMLTVALATLVIILLIMSVTLISYMATSWRVFT